MVTKMNNCFKRTIRYLAMVAKRPLQWGAEVIRRACDAFVRDRVTTQDVEQPEEGSA